MNYLLCLLKCPDFRQEMSIMCALFFFLFCFFIVTLFKSFSCILSFIKTSCFRIYRLLIYFPCIDTAMLVSCLTEGLRYIGNDCSWIWSTLSWAYKCRVWLKEKQMWLGTHSAFIYHATVGIFFLMDVVCGRIGLLYSLVAQRYQTLSLGLHCLCMKLLQKSTQFPTWPHGGSVTSWVLKWLHTWGESELPFAALPSRFCWWLRLGCGAQKDER